MDELHPRRTVHLKVPRTGRSLCGYEEEGPSSSLNALVVACPECSALIRSGALAGQTTALGRGLAARRS